MPKAAFNKRILSNELLLTLRGNMVGASLVNRNYDSATEITKLGDKVDILTPAAVTVRPYSTGSDMTIDELSGTSQTLTVDQANSFAFYAHDPERIADYVSAFTEDGAYRLVDAADQAIMGRVADAQHKVEVGADDDFLAAVREARRVLSVAKVPEQGRYLVVSPYEVEHVEEKLTNRETAGGDAVIGRGFAGTLYGFDVYVSHNVAEAAGARRCMVGTRAAVTYADAIADLETLRAEKRFADIVRGLHVFGMKTVRPEALLELAVEIPAP